MNRLKYITITIIGGLLLLGGVFAGIADADPANAILDITISNQNPVIGEQLVLTFTLTTYDYPAEEFNDWRMEFEYNTAMLELVPDSCTGNPDVWASGAGVGVGCAMPTANTVRIGEGNFTGASSPVTPLLLGTATFTVTGAGNSDFVILTGLGDTEFAYTPTAFPTWSPETIHVAQAENNQSKLYLPVVVR